MIDVRDRSIVLFSLAKKPFEKLSEISLRLFNSQDSFPYLLQVQRQEKSMPLPLYCDISLMWFIVLSQALSLRPNRTKGASSLEPITILSLGHDLAEDSHLCPVRWLKVYVVRTKPLGKGKVFSSFLFRRTSQLTFSKRSLPHFVYSNAN